MASLEKYLLSRFQNDVEGMVEWELSELLASSLWRSLQDACDEKHCQSGGSFSSALERQRVILVLRVFVELLESGSINPLQERDNALILKFCKTVLSYIDRGPND